MLDELSKAPLGPVAAVGAVGAAVLAGLSWLSGAGWVDNVVHESEFALMRAHVEDEGRHNAAAHADIKSAVSELHRDVQSVLLAVRK